MLFIKHNRIDKSFVENYHMFGNYNYSISIKLKASWMNKSEKGLSLMRCLVNKPFKTSNSQFLIS